MSTRRSNAKSSFGFGIFPELDELDATGREASIPSSDSSSKDANSSFEKPRPRDAETSKEDLFRTKRPFSSKRPATVVVSKLGAVGKKGEPLCLAELLALERNQGLIEPDYDETYEKLKKSGDATYLTELENMSMPELIAEARKEHVEPNSNGISRQELIFLIIKKRIKQNGLMYGEGTLEILPDLFGFLRSPDYHYLSSPDDIYISPSQIRRFGLRPGCTVSGQIRPPKENERYFALLRVEAVNHAEPGLLSSRPAFEALTPVYPNQQIVLTHEQGGFEGVLFDRMTPVGFGQRGLIAGPPKTGKTTLVRKMAEAAMVNHPEIYVFVLLLDERPEEVTETVRQLKDPRCEVVCSLFDDPPVRHVHVAEIVLEKAKRMVEYGKDVVIFLDSLTKYTRALGAMRAAEGNSVETSGPAYSASLQQAKRYFSSARKAEEGGSLTLFATSQIKEEDPFDDAVYNAFKGTGNLEILLNRELAEKRLWPAVDIQRSETRHEEFLLTEDEFQHSSQLRRQMAGMSPEESVDFLKRQLS